MCLNFAQKLSKVSRNIFLHALVLSTDKKVITSVTLLEFMLRKK